MRGPRAAACVVLAVGAAAGAARADDDEYRPTYSRYELESIHDALKTLGGAIDPRPRGKRIERVDVVTLDVIEKRDPAPAFLNWFHVTSKHEVIAREVLQKEGERFDPALVEETCRNLRAKPQLSLVLCLALRGSRPDTVRVLVITKDVWSIRLNWNFLYADGKLQQLILQPSETNLLGTHQVIAAPNFDLENDTVSLGGTYANPRFWGSWISTAVSGGVIVNRATGQAEGNFGSFSWGQPLYSTRVAWAWGGSVSWRYEVTRRYVGGNLAYYDAPSTEGDDTIPWVYTSDILNGGYSVTRSFGEHVKHNFELGFGASRNVFRVPPSNDPYAFVDPHVEAQAVADFTKNEVPVSDTRIGPYLTYHTFENRYMSVLNFNALGLQEDVQLGHEAWLRLQPVLKAWGSSRDFLAFFAGASYTWRLGDGLVRGYAQTSLDLAKGLPDATFSGGGRLETPTTPLGRLVLDSVVVDRWHDYLNTQSSLGGGDRLRGYPSNEFQGQSFFAANFEFRTRPLEILTLETAACVFFDVGDAFTDWNQLLLKHDVGAGLRMSLPQLNRLVFRLDWGFPLTPVPGVPSPWPGNFVITFGQAFGMPGTAP
ncbi:MAG TPA: hypothetical protein VHB21_27635 [Minicystis sp.]|nr:hypothetical protein [Minicystis sp.]